MAFVLLVAIQIVARPLLPIDETRYLDVAWEMRLSGDLFHLTRNFDLYTHKPPLLFWLINLVWLGTGVNEFAARAVAPAFAVLALWMTGRLARRFWPEDRGIAARAALALGGFSVFAVYGSATMFDTMLTVATLGGMATLWRIGSAPAEGRFRGAGAWALLGLWLALGVYAKGPVILVHLALPLVTMRLWAAAPPAIGALLRGTGIAVLVALALVALWLVPALLGGTAAYRHELLWTQSAARVAGGLAHDRPVWFLVALLPLMLFPWAWTLRLWPALAAVVRERGAARLCLIWAGAGLALFSLISGKQAHYLMPEFPAVALLVARAFGREGMAGRVLSLAPLLPVATGIALLAVALGAVPPRGEVALLVPAPAVIGVAVLAFALAALAWMVRGMVGVAIAGAGFVVALSALVPFTDLGRGYDARAIAARLAEAAPGGLAVVGMPYNAEFNFAARLVEPVETPPVAKIADWAAAHPAGLVFGPVGALQATPAARARYNGITYGFWPAPSLAGGS
ncbi:ArnT family glycosyltransferase [Albidovulum sp.]|uniref:ArnT family glycosyltransferase n=1 Tax=Albidovulum sp. TaxID=1872424 RepID=UPI001D249EF5|nr:glycosyltransferase family 39 protein [Paracoccaceae bacterium]